MDYQPLKLALMQQCGSSLRRALQNESMVPLDLFVRESVQNSLDAARKDVDRVIVEFTIRPHSSEDIAKLLPGGGVAGELRRMQQGSHRMLEIRDRNTQGLTGPLSLGKLGAGESHGNLLKLVYEVGRTQEREDAGGSWGLGKSIYFRIGIGLVFYYSRIRTDRERYAERLAACLFEDESSADRLQKRSATGIAWWGHGREGPLTDGNRIAKILKALKVCRYRGDETGTSVIVPFLRKDLGPSKSSFANADERIPELASADAPWWHADEERYIEVAVQRWYGVRLDNPSFRGGPRLNVAVGGRVMTREQMLPIFQVSQGLYNRAADSPPANDYLAQVVPPADVRIEEIRLNATVNGDTLVGKLAMVKLSPAQIRMAPPDNNPSPFWALYGRESAKPFPPMVGFLRGPGMIVRWDDRGDTRGWSQGFAGFDEDYLIALFVPEGSRALHPSQLEKLGRSSWTLEAYLRHCEMADHLQWTDSAGLTVVQRMRVKVGERIKSFGVAQAVARSAGSPLLAARILADRLLPRGFGSDGRNGAVSPSQRNITKRLVSGRGQKAPDFEVFNMRHLQDTINVDWKLSWNAATGPCTLQLLVDSERGPFSQAEWVGDGLGQFPVAIASAAIETVKRVEGKRHDTFRDGRSFLVKTMEGGSALVISPESGSAAWHIVEGALQIRLVPPLGTSVQPVLTLAAWDPPQESAP